MDIREYLDIIRRRWLIVGCVTVLTLIVAAGLAFRGPRAYEASTRIVVSVAVDAPSDAPPYVYYKDYYSWLSSEYLADDLSAILTSDAFADDIKAQLNEDVDRSAIRDVLRARKTHRILEVTAQGPTAERALRIAAAIGQVVRTSGKKYLAQLAEPNAQLVVIDDPVVKPSTTSGSPFADIGLRVLLGLFAGLFLAFVVDYLDSTLRSARAVEQALHLPVLGEIPATA